jgi:cellulose 1,4-beta-cellobiosidase
LAVSYLSRSPQTLKLTRHSDTAAKVPTVDTYLADIKAKNAAGASPPIIGAFVVYDLPNRDCAALASNGEYTVANDGVNKYKAYIDSIAAILKKYPDVPVSLVIGKPSKHLGAYHNHHN